MATDPGRLFSALHCCLALKKWAGLRKNHCHDPGFIFVIGTRQEWQFSFFSTSSATQSGALDLRISARRICFIMVHSLRSIAPHDAVNSLLPGPALGIPNSFACIWVNIITTNLGEGLFLLCFLSIDQGGGGSNQGGISNCAGAVPDHD